MRRSGQFFRDYSDFYVALVMSVGAFIVMTKVELILVGLLYLGLSTWLGATALRNRRRLAGLVYDGPAWRGWVFAILWYLGGPLLGAVAQSRLANETDGWAAGLGVWWACILAGYSLMKGQPYRKGRGTDRARGDSAVRIGAAVDYV